MNNDQKNALRIQIHLLQNHAPSNLNRDDLGAPKTCYFGGVLRSRISSQCLKRSIRLSPWFKDLCGGIRTRRLVKLIEEELGNVNITQKRLEGILEKCGLISKKEDNTTDMLVYTTKTGIQKMAQVLKQKKDDEKDDEKVVDEFKKIISQEIAVPDMALCGRMLETGALENTTVEAALQAAHAISTHVAHPEVDYYVAADDVPGANAGAGYVGEALYVSACYYKYFSIDWGQLLKNLKIDGSDNQALAARTVGAFIKAAAMVTPSGKQNSYAANNPPDGILVEVRPEPISYANAFAKPVEAGERDLMGQSVAQLAQYILDLDAGYGPFDRNKRFWFSPGGRYPLETAETAADQQRQKREVPAIKVDQLEELINKVLQAIDDQFTWVKVRDTVSNLPA